MLSHYMWVTLVIHACTIKVPRESRESPERVPRRSEKDQGKIGCKEYLFRKSGDPLFDEIKLLKI
jgi:hypothetical protein